MSEKMKYCKWCGEQIDVECVVCPKCGKQVEVLKTDTNTQPIYINNSASAAASNPALIQRKLPWYLRGFWIFILGCFTGGLYWIIGFILRSNWKSHN